MNATLSSFIFVVHEHQSIREVGLLETSYVSIEEGIPPTPEQVFLFLDYFFLCNIS